MAERKRWRNEKNRVNWKSWICIIQLWSWNEILPCAERSAPAISWRQNQVHINKYVYDSCGRCPNLCAMDALNLKIDDSKTWACVNGSTRFNEFRNWIRTKRGSFFDVFYSIRRFLISVLLEHSARNGGVDLYGWKKKIHSRIKNQIVHSIWRYVCEWVCFSLFADVRFRVATSVGPHDCHQLIK